MNSSECKQYIVDFMKRHEMEFMHYLVQNFADYHYNNESYQNLCKPDEWSRNAKCKTTKGIARAFNGIGIPRTYIALIETDASDMTVTRFVFGRSESKKLPATNQSNIASYTYFFIPMYENDARINQDEKRQFEVPKYDIDGNILKQLVNWSLK